MSETPRTVELRITDYLCGGGLFNPELANHDAVRDLLIDARDALAAEEEVMDAFEKWRKDYGDRMHAQGIVRNPTDEEAFRAGMRAAAELCHSVVVRGDIVTMELTAQRIKDAILAEADK